MSNTMTFKLQDGILRHQSPDIIISEFREAFPLTSLMIDIKVIKESIKSKGFNFLKNSNFAVAPVVATPAVATKGVFWNVFLTYLFPWMLDVAKVYCAIKIAQAFYQEKRGGRDEGTGFGALVAYGKWYLVFWLIPWGVELIDQVGELMFNDLKTKNVNVGG